MSSYLSTYVTRRLLLKQEQLHNILIFIFLLYSQPGGGHIPSNNFFALQLTPTYFKEAASIALFS